MGGEAPCIRLGSDDAASHVVGDVHAVCMLHVGAGAEDRARMIAGSIHVDMAQVKAKSPSGIEAAIGLKDRVVFRSRQHCRMVVVYASNASDAETQAARRHVATVCKVLQRDPLCPAVGYLVNYRDFAARFSTLLDTDSDEDCCNTDDEESEGSGPFVRAESCGSDTTLSSAACSEEGAGGGCVRRVCSGLTPSMEQRRRVAHSVVLSRSLQECPRGAPPTEVLPGLFLGNAQNAGDVGLLRSLGVVHVVNACSEIPNLFPSDFGYTRVDVADHSHLAHAFLDRFDGLVAEMRSASKHGAVLVHCLVGISRSCAVVAAYLMSEKRWTASQALEFIRNKRAIVNPNEGLREALASYERILDIDPKAV